MAMQALIFVIETVINLFVLAVLTRFYAQALRAPFRANAGNPIVDFIVAFTDFAVKPMRKIVPGMLGLDLASLLVAWFAECVLLLVKAAIVAPNAFMHAGVWPAVALLAMISVVKLSIYLLIGVVIVHAILSWVSPYHPVRPFFDALVRPFLKPFQRFIPLIGGVDLSAFALLIVLQVVLMVPVAYLEKSAGALLWLTTGG
ncbi:MAG: YggT family protein [Burkholderiales bacterium]|nr:YggT family protein [Burkholderiales bacterium]